MIIYINLVNDEKMRLTIPTHINYNTVAHENEKEEYKMYNPPMHSLWQLCKEDKILYRYPTKYSFDYGQMLVYISFIEQGSSK